MHLRKHPSTGVINPSSTSKPAFPKVGVPHCYDDQFSFYPDHTLHQSHLPVYHWHSTQVPSSVFAYCESLQLTIDLSIHKLRRPTPTCATRLILHQSPSCLITPVAAWSLTVQVFQNMQVPRFMVTMNAMRDFPWCGKYRERAGKPYRSRCMSPVLRYCHIRHQRDFLASRRIVDHGNYSIISKMATCLCSTYVLHCFCFRTRNFHKLGMRRCKTLHERMRPTLGLHPPRL
jgi:hypothetical protein